MAEHPERLKFRELCMDTLMQPSKMLTTGNYYRWGGNNHRAGSDCSGHIVGMRRELGYGTQDQAAQTMHDECVREGRPTVRMLGCLYFYGSSKTNITHVTLGYDDLVAIGANNGSSGTDTRAEAKARCAGWQFCDPEYRTDLRAVYVPDWWPWVRVTTADLNVREFPTLTGAIIETLPVNTPVELQAGTPTAANGYTWVPVRNGDRLGYVASEFLKR